MDTKVFYVAILSIAIGALMWQLGGFGDLFAGTSPGENLNSGEQVKGESNTSVVDGNFSGDARASDGSLVGLIISGAQDIIDSVTLVLYLPMELAELGLPTWAARPIGSLASVVIGIGLIQLVIGRVFH